MDERRMVEFRIGVFVLTTVVVLVILIIMFGPKKISLFSGDYKINVLFQYAPLIQSGSPVYKSGVEIGRVAKTSLVNNDREVKVILLIQKDVKIYSDEECKINSNIMGQSFISFQKIRRPLGPSFEKVDIVPADSTIVGIEPTDIVKMADTIESKVSGALTSFTDATKEITKSFSGINQMIGTPEEIDQRQKKLETMVDEAMKTMASVNKLSDGLESLVNDPDIQKNIRSTAKDVPKIVNDVQVLMGDARGMISDLRSIMKRMDQTFGKVDSNLDNVTRFTESLGEGGSKFFDSLNATADKLDITIHELEKFMAALNNPDGSIGRLLDDPEFFNGIRRTAKNLEDITLQVKPVLSDARVFSDKIARDPGILGAKGLITRSAPVKGSPGTNIGYVGADGEFPEQQPEFRLANLKKWWQCEKPQYKYVMPQRMSAVYHADYCEYPPVAEPEYYPNEEPAIIPSPVIQPSVPASSVTPPSPIKVSSERTPTRSVLPASAFVEQTSGVFLDYTPSANPSSHQHQVIPLPMVNEGPEIIATSNSRTPAKPAPALKLDFTPRGR